MTTTALVLLLLTLAVVALALAAVVDLLRHDVPGRAPRSHPADTFDPDAQRFGRCA